jgi:hypothetical protein
MNIAVNMPLWTARRITNTEIFIVMLLVVYSTSSWWIPKIDLTAALLDAGIWQLLLLSMLSFTGITLLSWWLLQQYWLKLGLPPIGLMVLQFKNLLIWQQFALYWASYALLVLAGVTTLLAVL